MSGKLATLIGGVGTKSSLRPRYPSDALPGLKTPGQQCPISRGGNIPARRVIVTVIEQLAVIKLVVVSIRSIAIVPLRKRGVTITISTEKPANWSWRRRGDYNSKDYHSTKTYNSDSSGVGSVPSSLLPTLERGEDACGVSKQQRLLSQVVCIVKLE